MKLSSQSAARDGARKLHEFSASCTFWRNSRKSKQKPRTFWSNDLQRLKNPELFDLITLNDLQEHWLVEGDVIFFYEATERQSTLPGGAVLMHGLFHGGGVPYSWSGLFHLVPRMLVNSLFLWAGSTSWCVGLMDKAVTCGIEGPVFKSTLSDILNFYVKKWKPL
jgi:hypothetical protein